MGNKSYKDQSKISWRNSGAEKEPTNEEIIVGSLQRIADASELMAQNYVNLQNSLDNYKRWYNEAEEKAFKRRKQLSTQQGVSTRYKNERDRLKSQLLSLDNYCLLSALKKIIEMNRQNALDQYGDAEKAETWACVIAARAAIEEYNSKRS